MEATPTNTGIGGALVAGILGAMGMWQQGDSNRATMDAKTNEFTVIIEALKEGTARQREEMNSATRRYEKLMDKQAADSLQSYQALLQICVGATK